MTVQRMTRMNGATKKGTAEASVAITGTTYHLPMRKGTLGPDVVDISALYQDTGRFTYDPGFTSTANCESKITFIDFDKGIVLYRGYPIEQLRALAPACNPIAHTMTSSQTRIGVRTAAKRDVVVMKSAKDWV